MDNKKRSLFFLLLFSFILLTIVPVSVIGIYSVQSATSALHYSTGVLFEQVAQKNAELLVVQLNALIEATNSIKDNQAFMEHVQVEESENASRKMDASVAIFQYMRAFKNANSNIYNITFIEPNGQILQYGEDLYLKELLRKPDYSFEKIYAMTKGKPQDCVWFPVTGTDNLQYMARYLYDYVNAEKLGIIILTINVNTLDEVFINQGVSDHALIVDVNENVVYSTNKEEIGKKLQEILEFSLKDIPDGQVLVRNDRMLEAVKLSNGWTLIPHTSYSRLASGIQKLGTSIILLMVCTTILSLATAMYISRTISNPINRLLFLMKKVEEGDISVHSDIFGNNREMTELSNGFNRMIGSMHGLISEITEVNDKLNFQVTHDAMTGLPNRRAYFNCMDVWLGDFEKYGNVAILYIDIDDFKNINDTKGHNIGDLLLIAIGKRLQCILPAEPSFLVHLGGDEFIAAFCNVEGIEEAEQFTEVIMEDFKNPYIVADNLFYVRVSVGVSLAPQDAATANHLLTTVDSALYLAKEAGKNTYARYDASVHERQMDELKLLEQLRKAIANKDFILHYQPQINLGNNQICGFEALLRWNDPERGIIMPGHFIETAERSGLILSLTEWILQEACTQAKKWYDQGLMNFTIGVNLSACQFQNCNIVAYVESVLQKTGLLPHILNLELTETVALGNIEYTLEIMEQIKSMGVCFSLDDFGTGYSSMNYLASLPFDFVKIDKSFVDNIQTSRESCEIMRAIVALAHALDMEVVTEGIEYQEQESIVRMISGHIVQGYFYSRPVTAADADILLQKQGGSTSG